MKPWKPKSKYAVKKQLRDTNPGALREKQQKAADAQPAVVTKVVFVDKEYDKHRSYLRELGLLRSSWR